MISDRFCEDGGTGSTKVAKKPYKKDSGVFGRVKDDHLAEDERHKVPTRMKASYNLWNYIRCKGFNPDRKDSLFDGNRTKTEAGTEADGESQTGEWQDISMANEDSNSLISMDVTAAPAVEGQNGIVIKMETHTIKMENNVKMEASQYDRFAPETVEIMHFGSIDDDGNQDGDAFDEDCSSEFALNPFA
jgi:hypothetical protein